MQRPFSFLKSFLSTLTEYRQLSGDTEINILHSGFDLIDRAITNIEKPSIELNATSLLMAAKYEELERLQSTLGEDQITPSLRETFAWSYIMQGAALSQQATRKSGAEADALFTAAGEKYEAALAIRPDKHEALNNWGLALSAQAKRKSGGEADALFAAAGKKCEAALAIKPDKHEALDDWGSLYLSWSRKKSSDEAERMLQKAEEKLLKAEEIRAGSGSYNLACVAARWGDAAACCTWLQRAQENGELPDRGHLLADPDLASVRDQPWFPTFLHNR